MIKWSDYSELRYLRISHTNMAGTVPKAISEAAALRYIDLSHNKLRGSIPQTVSRLSRLQLLNLSYNYLRGRVQISSDTLEHLALDGNQFTAVDVPAIVTVQCPQVRHISLANSIRSTSLSELSVPMLSLYLDKKTRVKYNDRLNVRSTVLKGDTAVFMHDCTDSTVHTFIEW